MSRWLLTFSRSPVLQYVGHLDLVRVWERTFRRAGIRVQHSSGFTPHSRLSFAAPLPVGATGRAELLDLRLEDDFDPNILATRLRQQLPEGLGLESVVPLEGPSLPSRLRSALYVVRVQSPLARSDAEKIVRDLLSSDSLPRIRRRQGTARPYDLRPLVEAIWLERWDEEQAIGVRVRAGDGGAGRADEVLDALGFGNACLGIERTQLILADP